MSFYDTKERSTYVVTRFCAKNMETNEVQGRTAINVWGRIEFENYRKLSLAGE
jgi:hypothetical protein